jgi:hypothetical protein
MPPPSTVKNKVLIRTIQPISGGVPKMLSFVLRLLLKKGLGVSIAYYRP